MLRAALGRIAAIVAVAVGGTAAISAALGALAGRNLLHALAVGYYVVGAAVLIGCFAVGARGPLRRDPREEEKPPAIPPSLLFSAGSLFRRRSMRKATPEERRTAHLASLGLFALAVLLILIGAAFDPSRRAF